MALVIKMIQADHIETTHEKKYLDFVTRKMNLNVAEIKEVRTNLKEYSLDTPENEQDRAVILYYLLFALASDFKISEQERAFLLKCSLQLGFRNDMIENMLGILKKYMGKTLPENALINEMKPFLN